MNQKELFAIWAPDRIPWSRWAAPVIFAQIQCAEGNVGPIVADDIGWAQFADASTAVVLDLPGAESVNTALALLPRGYWPVPVINASPGPEELVRLGLTDSAELKSTTMVDMSGTIRVICNASLVLRNATVKDDYRPAFLLDAGRMPLYTLIEGGKFDNRWMVIPQDFPSAKFLKSHGIARVLLVQTHSLEPQNDLAHVLRRWQDEGIEIFAKRTDDLIGPVKVTVRKPRSFLAPWYRALARIGLHRNSAGGFGSYIPESSGAG